MNFKNHQNDIKTYIETNLPKTLQEMNLDNFDSYVDDFVDLDRYNKKRTLFYDFIYHQFDYLSNESNSDDQELKIVMVFRGTQRNNLRDNMLDYTTAFYKMFEESGYNLGGAVDSGIIQTVNFYPYAEGNPDIKVAEVVIHLYSETD